MDKIENLILSGGAVNCFYFLGALDFLGKNNKLDNIESIAGVSIGSFIGCLLSIKVNAGKIADIISEICQQGPNWTYTHLLSLIPKYLRTGSLLSMDLMINI